MSWIDDLEALGEAATPGPWYINRDDAAPGAATRYVKVRPRFDDPEEWEDAEFTDEDFIFMAGARKHWPKIIAALRAAGATQAWYDAFTAQYGPDSLTSDAEAAFEAQTVALAALSDAVTGEKP